MVTGSLVDSHSTGSAVAAATVCPSLLADPSHTPVTRAELVELCDKWRIDPSTLGFRFHDLRHSAASYLAMSGATLAEIAEVLGHKTLAMVKRYSHLTEQHTSAVVARMNEKFLSAG